MLWCSLAAVSSTGCWSYDGTRLASLDPAEVSVSGAGLEAGDKARIFGESCPSSDNEWLYLGALERKRERSSLAPVDAARERAARVGGGFACLAQTRRGTDIVNEVDRDQMFGNVEQVTYRVQKTYVYTFDVFRKFVSISESELPHACAIHLEKIRNRPSVLSPMSPNPACIELAEPGEFEPPAPEVVVVGPPLDSRTHIDGRADAKPALEILFPLFGVTLGQTTVDELESLGTRDGSGSSKDQYVVVNGVNFWHYAKPVASGMYLTRDSPMPEPWVALGLDWTLSYSEWLDLLTQLGWQVDVPGPPRAKDWKGHPSLTARVHVTSGPITIVLGFDYSAQASITAESTLYSLRVDHEASAPAD